MSADNTIAILVTGGKEDPEYRVAHAQAVESIHFEPDYPAEAPVLNRERVIETFGKSVVFTDLDKAIDTAKGIEEEILDSGGIIEYPMKGFDHHNVPFPT